MESDTAIPKDFSHLQDVIRTLPMLKRYIVLCLFFSLEPDYSMPEVTKHLEDALSRLATAFPFLAGQVVYEGQTKGHSGSPRIKPLQESVELVVNDLTQDESFPSLSKIHEAGYPFSMLDPAVLGPPIAVSWTSDDTGATAPVLILQANFLRDGVILFVSGNHTTMDMKGLGIIIALFAKACSNEAFTEQEIKEGNQDRRHAIPLLGDEFEPGPELEDSIFPASIPKYSPAGAPPRWAYFNFTAEALGRLKKEASRQEVVKYISTDDAIGALCWQSIAKARKERLGSQIESTLCRVISVRNYLNLRGYIGHMADCSFEKEADVWERPLGEVAGRLRRLLLEEGKIMFHIRAFATLLQRLSEKGVLVNGALLDPHRDVVLSSYSNIRCCERSYGMLGIPEAAHRPRMVAWPSLLYLMPKSRKGDIAVAFCVSEDDLDRLRKDPVLGSYAHYVG